MTLLPVRLPPCSLTLAAALALAGRAPVLAQTDDFNDGNDTGWSRYNVFAAVGLNLASWTFPSGGYRIRTLQPSPDPSQLGPGRAGSLRLQPAYTDFYVGVDITGWDDSLDQAFGILARVTNPGLGTTDGYAFTYQAGDRTVSITRIFAESPSDVAGTSTSLTLDPAQKYRLVFQGQGSSLQGRVYQLPDLATPLVTVNGTDEAHAEGISGLVVFDNTTVASGLVDATFDNYLAAATEPVVVTPPVLSVDLPAPGQARVSWPASATGFVLQRSATLGATAAWSDVTGGIVEAAGVKSFTEAAGADPAWFRLRK